MAVIDSLGISAYVRVDGAAAVEYADPDPSPDVKYPDTPVVSKYIESKDDKEYAVVCMTLPQHSWLSTHKDHLLSFQVCADGKHRAARFKRPCDHDTRYSLIVDGVTSRPRGASHEILSKFKFDAMKIVDRDDAKAAKRDTERAAGLGSIRVEVWRSLNKGLTDPVEQAPKKTDMSIAEKALKGRAISHGTTLSTPTVVGKQAWYNIEKLYGKPYVIFEFKYRSKDGLRSEMIVPRTPSPDPAARGIAGLSQEEVQRLAEERLAEIKKEKKPLIKREFGEMFDLTGEDANGSPRPVKMPRKHKEPETIDLTDD
ncbi:hypothetical protein CONLIGDRAFT_633807 [Coniochaeta ligniaria NRRL 30616]|uniref:DUF7918 domain-containing protein n=1 Tax=Coniochaeta ligniaria NRRL 30616 TaxID=1408157 RepID=A0A1J7IJA8_9PEZI|nr:hypothetical protein CONLIGDRAFT_633807 [Coniochaeta ligniaria NRRL 30616]